MDVFKGVGIPDEDARTCAEVLIAADRRGIDSHGVGRLKPIYYDRIILGGIQQLATRFEVLRDYKDRIFTCGEKEYLASQERAARGVPVDPVIQQQLCAMRDDLGLRYVFPFEKAARAQQAAR